MTTRLTKEEQEAIEWTQKHRAGVELRNKVVIGIAVLVLIGYAYIKANIFMFGLTTSSFLIFFAELSLTFIADGAVVFILFQLTKDKEVAMVAAQITMLAAAAAAVAATAAAAAVAATAAAALVFAAAAYLA